MIARNGRFFLTILSFTMILIIFINLSAVHSLLLGVIASVIYFLINGSLLGRVFFEKEPLYLKLMLGNLLFLVLLGFVSWLVMIVYNLDVVRSVIALCVGTTLSSLVGLKVKHVQWDPRLWVHAQWRAPTRLSIIRLLYFSLLALSFYLLLMSRSAEVHTVWEVMHPAFIPAFFASTLLLLALIFSSEKAEHKLLFTIIHSVLSHFLFVIIFPAGDIGGQQIQLVRTRLVYDNVILHGFGQAQKNILSQIYYWLRGDSFHAALSVILARMFSIDVYWIHLFLVPILWGTFVPIVMFTVTKLLGQSDNVSVLSSLLLSVFPLTIYWGAFSVPNSLGFIFFLFALIFSLKYLHSDESKVSFLMMGALSFVSFMAHFLTGIISFSLLLLAIALRKYEKERRSMPITAKLSLLVAFIFSASLLPLSLVYQRLFYPLYTYFALEKMSGLSAQEIFWSFIFGEYLNYSPGFLLAMLIGPLLGFAGMLYLLYRNTKQKLEKNYSICALFLFIGFLLFLTEYRILKLLMVNIPFKEERLWAFRDFLAVPFVAVFVAFAADGVVALLRKITLHVVSKVERLCSIVPSIHVNLRSNATLIMKGIRPGTYITMLVLLSGWVTASVYYAYPHWAPLQTTSYELEAVRYIEANTTKKYIVISDQWIIYAGGMIVGIRNPRAYYFATTDPKGLALFTKMKDNPFNETMVEAMKINNATVAYFIIAKPRLGAEEYNRTIEQAKQNNLQTYPGGVFYYGGEEKLHIFYYEKQLAKVNE